MYIRFSREQMLAMCGGQFPEANGFNWASVHYFTLDTDGGGFINPYTAAGEILPGPSFELKIKAITEWPAKITYRVMESHCGDPEVYSTGFSAQSDEEAWTKFEELAQNPSYGMSYIRLERIDVAERTTNIGSAERKHGTDKPATLHRLQ